MISFHGKQEVKDKYLRRVRRHAKLDQIVKGHYWVEGKGCAVGCTIHGNQHDRYERELGVPTWLAHLEDHIFENLPNEEAMTFPEEFLDAIPVGADLERVKWRFCAFLMKENIERVLSLDIPEAEKEGVLSAIRQVLTLHNKAARGGVIDEAAWSAAWSAAESAAESAAWSAARSAAWSAARSAAWSATWSAASSAARSAAESAAWSATSSAARSAAYSRYKKKLLQLLRKAK